MSDLTKRTLKLATTLPKGSTQRRALLEAVADSKACVTLHKMAHRTVRALVKRARRVKTWFPKNKGDIIVILEPLEAHTPDGKPVKLRPDTHGVFMGKEEDRKLDPSPAMLDQLGPAAWADYEGPRYHMSMRWGMVYLSHEDFLEGRATRIPTEKEVERARKDHVLELIREELRKSGDRRYWTEKKLMTLLDQRPDLRKMLLGK